MRHCETKYCHQSLCSSQSFVTDWQMCYAKKKMETTIIDVNIFEISTIIVAISYISKLEKNKYTYIVIEHPRCNAKLVIECLCGVPNPFNLVKGITIPSGMKKGKALITRFQVMILINGTKRFGGD